MSGWLLVFAVALFLALIVQLGQARSLAYAVEMDLGELFKLNSPVVGFVKLSLGAQLLLNVVIYWMMWTKSSAFRLTTTWILLGTLPAIVGFQLIFNPFDGLGSIIAQGLFPWILSNLIWTTYVNKSRRVRVTFESKVRCDGSTGTPESITETQTPEKAERESDPKQDPTLEQSIQPRALHCDSADEAHWAQALAEFESPQRRPGLWARSFVQAKGDETMAKVFYLAARVEELARGVCNADAENAQRGSQRSANSPSRTKERMPESLEGTCPNCTKTLSLSDEECPHCGAVFGPGSAWAPIPLVNV